MRSLEIVTESSVTTPVSLMIRPGVWDVPSDPEAEKSPDVVEAAETEPLI